MENKKNTIQDLRGNRSVRIGVIIILLIIVVILYLW
jgi:hypothetical protein